MNFEIYRNGRSLGMVDPTIELARQTCRDLLRHCDGSRYEAVVLPAGRAARPGLHKLPDAEVAHVEYRPD